MKSVFSVIEISDTHIMSQRILGILKNKKMEYIIKHYYGLFDNEPRDFKMIAHDLDITETYVRQLHQKSLIKIRCYTRSASYIQEYF